MTMENFTNNYTQNSGRLLQLLSEQMNNSDSDMLVLDLSRKNHVTDTSPKVTKEKITVESSESLRANVKRYPQISLPEEDRQTPIAGSSAMLSPYSESNSPKRMKIESSIDHYKINNQLKHSATVRRDITPGITMITPQQPSLPMLSKEAPKIPLVMPTMPIPYMESISQSYMINNETSRKILLAVPSEYTTSTVRLPAASPDIARKAPRPFKAYSKNHSSVAPIFDYTSNEDYAKFREMMLENVKKASGNISNPKMRRVSKSPGLPTSTVNERDAAYREKRRKNNEAAKRSRDARRAKEDELAIRTAFLEQENYKLKCKLQTLHERYAYLFNSQY